MTTTVEVKFDGSNWTDITSYLRNVQVRRGRANDLSTVDPGVATVELDNADGRFTPTNTQSPYSPNVKPAVAVRVTQNAGAGPSDYRLFTGKAQRWEPQWTVGGRPIVVLEAVDGFEQFANADLEYPFWHTVREESPDGYWPLGDATDDEAVFPDRSGNGRDLAAGAPVSAFEYGKDPQVVGGEGALGIGLTPATVGVLNQFPVSWMGDSNDFTAVAMFRFDGTVGSGSDPGAIVEILAARGEPFSGSGLWEWQVTATGMEFTAYADNSAGSPVFDFADVSLSWTADVDYLIGIHWDQSTNEIRFYRDGVRLSTSALANGIGAPVGQRVFKVAADESVETPSTVSEVVFWPSDKRTVISELQSSRTGFPSDLPGVRIGRVLDWAGWPAGDRDVDTGTTPLAGLDGGESALSACQDAAGADGGVFFIAADGDATFQGRRERWEDPAAIDYSDRYVDTYGGTVVDFDDDGTDTGYQTVGWRYDTTLLANRVEVDSNTQGTSDGLAEDSTSQDDYGLRTLSISTISNNSDDNAHRAQWELSRRKDPHLRLEQVAFLVADTVQEDAAGALELQSLVEVNRRPGTGQDDLTVTMRVASIEHRISDGGSRWEVSVGLLEADTDQPAIYGTAVYGTDYYGY